MSYRRPPQVRETQKAGTNSTLIKHALKGWTLPKIDIMNAAEVEQRITDYLDYCLQADILPSVNGVCNWLGITRQTLHNWRTGQRNSEEHQRIINRFYGICEDIWSQEMLNGTANPIPLIFIGKCFYGYKDNYEVTINNPEREEVSIQDLIAESKRLPNQEDTGI